MKDCDNLAKGLIDAFEGILYVNDSQVDHLDVLRVHRAGSETGYALIRCGVTPRINDHSDVIDPIHARIEFLTATELRFDHPSTAGEKAANDSSSRFE